MSELVSQTGSYVGHPSRRWASLQAWLSNKLFMGQTLAEYLKSLVNPFNAVAAALVLIGLALIAVRFVEGLASVTGASQDQPWGLMLAWGLFTGVPMAASGFVLAAAVYLVGLKQYHAVLKNAVLLGFLGYLFAVTFLVLDLGRPWRLPYPLVVSWGTSSVLLEVALCISAYLSVLFLEFAPSIFEWLDWKTPRKWLLSLTIALTIFGVVLSTLHQSSLGAMFLLTPGKLHPLWYTPYLPNLFFVSAIANGLAVLIVVSKLTQWFFKRSASQEYLASIGRITLGLAKAAAFVLFVYLGMRVVALTDGHQWALLNTPYGYLYLVEVIGLVLLPCFALLYAANSRRAWLAQLAAVLVVLGTILNRFNVSMIAFNWQLPEREFANPREFLIVLAVITIEILVYRAIVNRMPILHDYLEPKGDPGK